MTKILRDITFAKLSALHLFIYQWLLISLLGTKSSREKHLGHTPRICDCLKVSTPGAAVTSQNNYQFYTTVSWESVFYTFLLIKIDRYIDRRMPLTAMCQMYSKQILLDPSRKLKNAKSRH